jgi:hypothetical protein
MRICRFPHDLPMRVLCRSSRTHEARKLRSPGRLPIMVLPVSNSMGTRLLTKWGWVGPGPEDVILDSFVPKMNKHGIGYIHLQRTALLDKKSPTKVDAAKPTVCDIPLD